MVKTPFGFFLCRVEAITKMRGVSFQEAHNQLIYLATRERYLSLDSLIEEKAFTYYKNHEEKYINPDTIILKTWLLPSLEEQITGSDTVMNRRRNITIDTAHFQPMIVNSLVLPDKIRKTVEEEAMSQNKKIKFIGPVIEKLGIWYFKIDTVRENGTPIPFYGVRNEIGW